MNEVKREKRRLDDLLTIRESEIYKLKEQVFEIEKKEFVINQQQAEQAAAQT